MQSGEVVTVVGEARSVEKNQVASFSAGVESVNDDKEKAIREVNEKVVSLVGAIKAFGVPEADIKTQNLSIYQSEEMYYENGVQKSRKGQWRVNNSIEVTLREVANTADLTVLLTNSGANNVYGPNFRMDEGKKIEVGLFIDAMADAKEKAEMLAKASGRKLGKVMSVTEGGGVMGLPLFSARDGMGGGGMPTEPGSTTVTKSVTVTWELK